MIEIYNKYINSVTCAFKDNVYIDRDNNARINAQRTKEPDKYLFKGLKEDCSDNIILIECPKDVLAIEFEEHSTTKDSTSLCSRENRNTWITQTYENAKNNNLECCVADHGGTSQWLYLFNLINLPLNNEFEAKKEIAKKIIPADAIKFIDWSNFGKTLIPIINRPHWKPKYNGAIHQIVAGSPPQLHNNDISHLLIDFKFKEKRNLTKDLIATQLKEQIDLKDVLLYYEYDITKKIQMCKLGHDSVGKKCFGFDLEKQLWHCFHCGAGGDIFDLVMQHDNVNFPEAKRILINLFNINIDISLEVFQLLALNKKREATEKICKTIVEIETIYTIRDDKNIEMWIYKDGIYIPQAKTYVKELCRNILKEVYTIALFNEVINKIESDTYITQENFFINEDINLIAVQNGVLNIKTKELLPFSPKYKFFNKLPVTYNSNAECNVIKKHLKTVLKSDEDFNVIQEIIGYCLYRDYKYEKAFMFCGGGRNGKGKTVELIKRFLGAENITSISLQKIEKEPFSISELFNKLANICGDLDKKTLHSSGNFKQLTGHDMISASRKFLSMIYFVNYAKMIFLANDLPETSDRSIAFFDRWILIDFPHTFKIPTDYYALSENERHKYILADTSHIDKISTPEELSGLLNWSLEGLQRLIKQNGFSTSSSTEEIKIKWLRKSNNFNAFVLDCLEENYEGEISKKDLRHYYGVYCKKYNLKPVADNSIFKILTEMMNVTQSYKQNVEPKIYVWDGIQFKKNALEKLKKWEELYNSQETEKKDLNSFM